nr:immunoglobulin heavy chain junction region [Mus musculus]MBK4189021.1 immunoglobulin heavy chain junction region [Mus musculus]MBK4189022.1 immunoglobulin heavy chain junction region [Mus musculus]MBK4189024.1 immunoglobulin heavy chain junction region [Mus musculus]MBK4189025.1 immunoglobulin heavy chain junction region [Mus musculus]
CARNYGYDGATGFAYW